MPRVCVAGGCSNRTADGCILHSWPKNPQLARIWTRFVKNTRANWTCTKWSLLCSAHFAEDSYETSELLKSKGYQPKLKENAVPTIKPTKKTKRSVQREPVVLPNVDSFLSTDDYGGQDWPEYGRRVSPLDMLASTAVSLPYAGPAVEALTENAENEHFIKEPRSAFKKRENRRILQDIELENVMPVMDEFDDNCLRSDQVDSCVQTKPDTRTIGTQKKYKWKGVDTGVQCELLMPPPPEPDFVSDEDLSSDDESLESMDTHDPDYIPEDDCEDIPMEEPVNANLKSGRVFLVYESSLMELFAHCSGCQSECTAVVDRVIGSAVKIHQKCSGCDVERRWNSQPYIGDTPAGNLMISASTLFSGSSISKVLQFLRHLDLPAISYRTFLNHQNFYLQPAIEHVWKEDRGRVMEDIVHNRGGQLDAAGDGRADSPGHSAKYGSYTLMDTNINKIVDFQLVTVTEVANSNAMEKEGLKRAIAAVEEHGVKLKSLTTDRHVSIRKYLREDMKDVKHSFDVWHTVKGLAKKIDKLGKLKGYKKVLAWKRSITHHMYWIASSTPEAEPDVLLAKWMSIPNHIQGIHRHDSELFPKCLHGKLRGRDRKKKWMVPNEADTEKLVDMLTKNALLKDIQMLSCGQQTSNLESYHSVVNHFAPKMIHFSYHGMKNRLMLSALHFNENSSRQQASTKDGKKRYRIVFPKFKKGQHTLQKVMVPCTYGYVDRLKDFVVSAAEKGEKAGPKASIPPPMCHQYSKPDKDEAVKLHMSRFRRDTQ